MSLSLSIPPTLSPLSLPPHRPCPCPAPPPPPCCSVSSARSRPISLFARPAEPEGWGGSSSSSSSRRRRGEVLARMTISELRNEAEEEGKEEEEEVPPPLLDSENNSRPRRIALFVEPSPFAWVFPYLGSCCAGGSVLEIFLFFFGVPMDPSCVWWNDEVTGGKKRFALVEPCRS